MSIVKVSEHGKNLGTRLDGRLIRHEISNKISISVDVKVIIDFSDVKMISGSFADECIGQLVTDYGFESIRNKISIRNSNENVTLILKQAIKERLIRMHQYRDK